MQSQTDKQFRFALSLAFWLVGLFPLCVAHVASAVNPPSAGSILQQIQQQEERTRTMPKFEPKEEEESAELQPLGDGVTVLITELVFKGNETFSSKELAQVIASDIDQEVVFSGLQKMQRAIAEHYRSKGFWARVILPAQSLENGKLILRVIEGRIGDVQIDSKLAPGEYLRFPEERAVKFMRRGQDPEKIFSISEFDQSIRWLSNVPGINATAILAAGKQVGETDVIVQMSNTPIFSGNLRVDNNGSRSTGYNGLNASLNFDSPVGLGEQFSVQLTKTEGVSVATLGASYPLLDDGTRLGMNYTDMSYEVCCGPLSSSGGKGNSQSVLLSLNHSFLDRNDLSISGNLSLGRRNYFNESLAGIASDKRIDALSIGSDISWPGSWMYNNAVNRISLSYHLGKLDLGNDPAIAENVDSDIAGRQGNFKKLNLNASRQQDLGESTKLWLSFLGQWGFDNLDSAEKISLGGSSSVRAYPGGEASGDSGFVATVELRQAISSQLQGSLFYDHGYIKLNHELWSGWNGAAQDLKNDYQLKGVGLGMNWRPHEKFNLAATVSTRLGNNPGADADENDGDGTKKDVRGWLSLALQF